MSLDLTPEQLNNLQSLGLDPNSKPRRLPLIPLLSISGLSLLSFGGLVLFKTKTSPSLPPSSPAVVPQQRDAGGPTQVPKSIQHYLLTSQQFFTQAIANQKQDAAATAELLNQSILAATDAIKEFPQDYRGYDQRGRIYQSLLDSQPQFLDAALADFSTAYRLYPSSAEITRSLASIYARRGDPASTTKLLLTAISLDPTKAQNFYDLAKIQQQQGLLSEALNTYSKLLTLVSDPVQVKTLESEKASLERLISQAPVTASRPVSPTSSLPSPEPTLTLPDSPSLIQANAGLPAMVAQLPAGLIIAAPETSQNIALDSQSQSNALSGTAILPAHTAELTLHNQALTPSTQVYLTVTKGGKNLNFQLLSRSQDSFTVGLDSPTSEDIEFKWWLVK